MPWTTKDAREKDKSIKTDKQARQWVEIANSTLKRLLAKGIPQAQAEARAIMAANGTVGGKKKKRATEGLLLGRLVEFIDNRGVALRVDKESGVVHGVKLLGRSSLNGRQYPAATIRQAAGLYEGKPVNVDHGQGSEPRSYRDRIARISAVQIREDGLYGDLLVNPKHELAEQLLWDAEHAPENVGLSHDAQGKTKHRDGREVVESIDRVRSVDLVADPATTRGLFEAQEGEMPDTSLGELTLADVSLEELRAERPDLVTAIEEAIGEADDAKTKDATIADLTKKLKEAEGKIAEADQEKIIAAELAETKIEVSDEFRAMLLAEPDKAKRSTLIKEVQAGRSGQPKGQKPQSSPSGMTEGQTDAVDWDHFSDSIREEALV